MRQPQLSNREGRGRPDASKGQECVGEGLELPPHSWACYPLDVGKARYGWAGSSLQADIADVSNRET